MNTRSSSPSSVSRVKPLAILATVDLRPKPVDTALMTETESHVPASDDIPHPTQARVQLVVCDKLLVVAHLCVHFCTFSVHTLSIFV